jgi:hypothetical protein
MTSQSSAVSNDPGSSTLRHPLRLQLSESPGRAALDGGWWPQSRDIDIELADLVDRFPPFFGRVHRALYSRPDWETQPRNVRVARGMLKTGSFPRDDTHLMILSMSTHTRLHLLVVPPAEPLGRQAMTISADPWNRLSAAEILASIAFEAHAAEGDGIWTDEGCHWWGEVGGPPSFRRGS